MANGDFTHIEIPAADTERAIRFYRDLFGWQFQEAAGFSGYNLFQTPGGEGTLAGAIGQRGVMAPPEIRVYVNVDSIDETLPRLGELGGSVVQPKTEITGQGWFAVINDSEGNTIALFEALPADQAARLVARSV
jgi:predicted enzyme related to lactoylglutathione lyase